MKEQKQVKTPEAIAAEQAEIERLRAEVASLCNRVPQCVLAGSYDRAIVRREEDAEFAAYAARKIVTEARKWQRKAGN